MTADSASSSSVRPAQWQAVHDVFVAALELDDDERDAFIARETSDRPDVAKEVSRLLRLHQAAGPFLETADDRADAGAERLLADGDVVADRFEVRRLLGRGGMADVYEARDRILGEGVALKVMRSPSGDATARTELFRREVQLARRVTHGGVCRVHDVAFHRRRDGQPLLVFSMELLAGETLAERVRRGPLSSDQARTIATEIATALDTAHAHGIVHGDIKPENVIVCARPDGATRVVLTDFGLANGMEAIDQESPGAGLMGTPAYMAPELFRGVPRSTASDLYAFALLTYRVLSGKDDLWRTTRVLAFASGATSRLPAGLNDLDPTARQVFAKALSVEPAQRFSSATEFVRSLFPQAPARNRRAAVITALAATAVVALLSVGPFLRMSQPSIPEDLVGDAPSPLLLTATINDTGEAELDGVTELLRGQLAQSPRLDVLGPDVVPGVLREMRHDTAAPLDASILREVALRQHAALIVLPRVTRAAAGYELRVRLEHIGARPSIVENAWEETFQAPHRERLLDIVRRAALWLRTTAGESEAQLRDQDRLPSETTTASWDALREFAKAQQSHQRGDLPNAVVYLREAIRLDPEFVWAYARLGDVLVSIRSEQEGFAAWQRAVELADYRQLTTREALRLRGQFLEETATVKEAEAAFRAYALHYPDDFNANLYLGMMIAQQGRTEEAIPWLERATKLRPAAPSGHVFLATQLIELERFDEASSVADRLRQTTQPEFAIWQHAQIAFAQGDLDRAMANLEPLRKAKDPQWRSRFVTLHGSWLAEAGRIADAERELAAGVAFDVANGLRSSASLKWLHVARFRADAGDGAASADAARKAIGVSQDARTLALAGDVFARLGMVDELTKLRDTLPKSPGLTRVRLSLRRIEADLQRVTGRPDLAAQTLDAVARELRFTTPREFYIDALMAAGRDAEAMSVLASWVQHPARFYAEADLPSPGPWAAALERYQALLERNGRRDEAVKWADRLSSFRATTSGNAR
jgi:tetratricopeptide (TPR) repeat protein/tRNA A-37 threonylcarbamoyl transferase component Bud32